MPRRSAHRLLALALLIAWSAPGLGGLAIGFHVTSSHHHDDALATQLALVAVHGHSHDLAQPAHEHAAVAHGGISQAPLWFAAGTAEHAVGAALAATAASSPPVRWTLPDPCFHVPRALRL